MEPSPGIGIVALSSQDHREALAWLSFNENELTEGRVAMTPFAVTIIFGG